jgi:hypothetical protein
MTFASHLRNTSIPKHSMESAQQQQQRRRKIDCKPELIISSLQKFYGNYSDIESILPYLQGSADLSLRLIDWFVTNYCRKHFIGYPLNGQEFLVYISYKSQLKAYSKQYFDPNCRRERIMFQIPGHESFLTTVGKLNFFRWAIETKLLDYIQKNYEAIQNERNEAMSCNGKKSRTDTESSQSSIRTVSTVASTDSVESAVSTASADSAVTLNTVVSAATAATAASEMSAISAGGFSCNSAGTTRRRRSKQIPAASRQLQKHECSIVVTFD